MKKAEMIKAHREFTEIINTGKSIKNHDFAIFIRKSIYSYSHFGIAVSKKLGNAVERNLLKRRMRCIIDNIKKELPPDEDYIIIMKEHVKNLSFQDMTTSFENLILTKEKK